MKESYGKDPASHPDPESCVGGREDAGEALTGAHAGQPLSSEITLTGVPTPYGEGEGNMADGAKREPAANAAESETLSMRGNSSHEKREIRRVPAGGAAGRPEKVYDRTSGMYARGKSDDRVVPEKPPNKGVHEAPAEVVEGRRSAKGNTMQATATRTQSRLDALIALDRVREAARRDRRARFTALLHHVTFERLKEGFYALKHEAAPGVDGLTWEQYDTNLEERLRDLHRRIHGGTYRARPSRRGFIPKADGRQRPLGIAALEDKIVQKAVVRVLNQIYEVDFLGFSYGFRPRRSQHDALDALWVGLMRRKVNWVLDADIRGFFDNIDRGWLLKFLEHRVADRRILRLVQQWLEAGVIEDGQWTKTEVGTPQGAVASPLLANVFLHYVFDLWVQQWRTKSATGDVLVVRYADDFVMGFQHRHEAERFLRELGERFDKFGLALHPDKTRLIEFGRFAAENRRKRGERKPETFTFLGFIHICGQIRGNKGFIVKRETATKRLRAKLTEVKSELALRRHEPIPQQGKWLRSVVRGYFNYHGVPGNTAALKAFSTEITRSWLRALRRRGQRRLITWQRFRPHADRWIPRPKIMHPFPDARFDAKHPR
jgi:group II intron reverse transcriptase/maturase